MLLLDFFLIGFDQIVDDDKKSEKKLSSSKNKGKCTHAPRYIILIAMPVVLKMKIWLR